MSSCITAVPGTMIVQFVVTMPPAGLPMKNTRSASETARLAHSREYVPDDAHRQRMRVENDAFAVERSDDGDLQLLRELDDFALRLRAHHAAARDDDRLLRFREHGGGFAHALRLGLGPERRHAAELRLDDRFHLGVPQRHVRAAPLEAQVHRTGRARRCGPESLAQQVGQARWVIDVHVGLGHRIELNEILDFLVRVPVARGHRRTAGNRDDGRARHVRIAQARREVRRTDRLRHAHARAASCARVTVGHVGCGLLAVRDDAAYVHVLHRDQRFGDDLRHVENVRDAVALHDFSEKLCTGGFCHDGPPGKPRGQRSPSSVRTLTRPALCSTM